MGVSLGIIFGFLISVYILPILDTLTQVIISNLNIYISENNLNLTMINREIQENEVEEEYCNTNAIGFQYIPAEDEWEFDYDEEDDD